VTALGACSSPCSTGPPMAEFLGSDPPVVCAFCGEDTLTSETEPVDRTFHGPGARICCEFISCSDRAYRRSMASWAGRP
jgi:hypothetical protein